MCEISMVQKLSPVNPRRNFPTNTNISIREIPVIISGLIIGISVIVLNVLRNHRVWRRSIPQAAAVPITADNRVALVASSNEFFTDSKVFLSFKSSKYHRKDPPENTDKLFAELREI